MIKEPGSIFLPEGWSLCPVFQGSGKDEGKKNLCGMCGGIGRILDPVFEKEKDGHHADSYEGRIIITKL